MDKLWGLRKDHLHHIFFGSKDLFSTYSGERVLQVSRAEYTKYIARYGIASAPEQRTASQSAVLAAAADHLEVITEGDKNLPWYKWYKRPYYSIWGIPIMMPWVPFYNAFWKNLINVLDLTYTAFIFPYTLAFHIRIDPLAIVIACIFMLDMMMKTQIAWVLQFKHKRRLVTRGSHILYYYWKYGGLLFDLVSTIPWFVAVIYVVTAERDEDDSLAMVFQLLRILRLFRLWGFMKSILLGTFITRFNKLYLDIATIYLLALGYSALVLINLLGCAWYMTGARFEWNKPDFVYDPDDAPASWLFSAGGMGDVYGDSQLIKFICSVYFVVTTLTTTGYGDIVPQNTSEQIMAMVIMGCGAFFFAFLIGSVVNLMTSSGREARMAAALKEKMEGVNSFLKNNGVSSRLRNKIFIYFRSTWLWHEEEKAMWDSCLHDLTPGLRTELMGELLSDVLKKLGLFQDFTEAELKAVAGLMEPHVFPPDTDICNQGDDATSFWIAKEGSIQRFVDYKKCGDIIYSPTVANVDVLQGQGGHKPTYKETVRTVGSCTVFSVELGQLDAMLRSLTEEEEVSLRAKIAKNARLMALAEAASSVPCPRAEPSCGTPPPS